jgi:hypothetical protein
LVPRANQTASIQVQPQQTAPHGYKRRYCGTPWAGLGNDNCLGGELQTAIARPILVVAVRSYGTPPAMLPGDETSLRTVRRNRAGRIEALLRRTHVPQDPMAVS